MAGYETREARTLFLAALGHTEPMTAKRADACRVLLEEFAALARELGVHIEARPFVKGAIPSLVVGIPTLGLVRLREERGALVARKESSPLVIHDGVVIPLDFDPTTGRFTSSSRDEFLAPTPGEPWPRRSPLAVVVEVVLGLLETGTK